MTLTSAQRVQIDQIQLRAHEQSRQMVLDTYKHFPPSNRAQVHAKVHQEARKHFPLDVGPEDSWSYGVQRRSCLVEP